MPIVMIACQMLEDEIALALKECGREYPTTWVERQLHTSPERLCAEVQKLVAQQEGNTVLMAMAQCGNAFVGLKSMGAKLVIPKFADCIHMLCSTERGSKGNTDARTLYLTRGWLQGDRSFLNEYRRFAEKHGEEKAKKIYASMMAQYKGLRMVDTDAYDLAAAEEEARRTANVLGVEYGTVPGTVRVLLKLFKELWDDEFLIVPPGKTIQQDDFE